MIDTSRDIVEDATAIREGWVLFCEGLFSGRMQRAWRYAAFHVYHAGVRYGEHRATDASLDPGGIAERIRAGRKRKGQTQAEFAKEAGISRSYLCQIENGAANEPSFRIIVKLLRMADELERA